MSGNALPPLKEYSKDFQTQLRTEQPTVRACCPNTNTFVKDSITLRNEVKAGKDIIDTNKKGLAGGFKGLFGVK